VTEYSRLDDRNLEDPIIRSFLYNAILAQSGDYGAEGKFYTIQPDEQYRPDLAAFRAYETEILRWVITLLAGGDDEASPLPVGNEIRLPSRTWIRERIRHFSEGGGIE
jgi:hypothetical protein